MKYKTRCGFAHGELGFVTAGKTIDINEATAKYLMGLKLIVPAKKEKPAKKAK